MIWRVWYVLCVSIWSVPDLWEESRRCWQIKDRFRQTERQRRIEEAKEREGVWFGFSEW